MATPARKSSHAENDYALEFKGIDKRFGPVTANRGVNLGIPRGSIYGLIGENGAGKSTLMKIVYGMYRPDRGSINVFGTQQTIASPRAALALGIGMVHQHFMLVDRMTVVENVLLGRVAGYRLEPSLAYARQRIAEIARTYDLVVDPEAIIADLPVGIRQRVEIIKALFHGARILILDEPTAVLSLQEAEQLFVIMRHLQADGVTCVLITHKLREILTVTDRVAVMRGGKVVGQFITDDCDEQHLSTAMIGQDPIKLGARKSKPTKEVALSVTNLVYRDNYGIDRLRKISFSLHKGEILGIAGVTGNGQSELLELLSGMLHPTSGEINVLGETFSASRNLDGMQARQIGLAHVPEDRLVMGIVPEFSAGLNFLLGYQYDEIPFFSMINNEVLHDRCSEGMHRFNVQPHNSHLAAQDFSGGNQQKLIIAREISRNRSILLAGQPTRGVDIGAIATIHNLLLEHRNKGGSILLVSSELDEILALSDRILVMLNGTISGEVDARKADRKQLGLWMTAEGLAKAPNKII